MGKAEAYVEDYLRAQAEKYDCLCYKFTSPGTKGVPDDIVIYNGETRYIETKSPVGQLQKIQRERIRQMRAHGAKVAICHTRTAIDTYLATFIPNYQPGNHNAAAEQKPTRKKESQRPAVIPIIKPIRTDTPDENSGQIRKEL